MKYWKPSPGGKVRILPGKGITSPEAFGLLGSNGSMQCRAPCPACDLLVSEDRRVIQACIARMFPLLRTNRPELREWAQLAFTAREARARLDGGLRGPR